MSARSLSRLAVVALVLLGLFCTSTRFSARRASQTALNDSLWRLSYDIGFESEELERDEAEVRVALPLERVDVVIINEDFLHPDLQAKEVPGNVRGSREQLVATRHSGVYRVTAKFDIRLRSPPWRDTSRAEKLSSSARERYTRSEVTLPVQSPNVQRILRSAPNNAETDGELLQWMFEYVSNLKPGTSEDGGDDVAMAEVSGRATSLGRARLLVTLSRAARLPARLVTGFELRQSESPRPHHWVEVFRNQRWIPFDAQNGFARRMPRNFLAVRHGGERIVRGQSVKNLTTEYSIVRLAPDPAALTTDARNPSQILDLTRLPLEMHKVISLMLLLPLGALVTAVFRNIIGIRTFGTFAPSLLAVSFIYAAWGTGIVVLSVIVIGGLIGRSLLERLHLLMVPRLSVILTTIILSVAFGVSLLEYVDVTQSPQAVLLPLVILTMMIERLYVTAEEDGMSYSFQLAFNTLIVALCCYLLIRGDEVGQLILIYPELHFFTIATFILIGRYTGYRLTELWRFRDVVQVDEDVS